MWAMGVILYVLMCGYLPFQGRNRGEIFDQIKKLKYSFDLPEFKSVSDEAKNLIKKLLVLDPK